MSIPQWHALRDIGACVLRQLLYTSPLARTIRTKQITSSPRCSCASSILHQTPSRRLASTYHTPGTVSKQESVYVLTLLTDKSHHERMTALRNKYFPAHLNKLDAHLTLFHALPGSKLESSIIPVIEAVAGRTAAFSVLADATFRLKRGIAISIADHEGQREAHELHRALQQPWLDEGFLSRQDSARRLRLHYTVMNKVDEPRVIDAAFEELQKQFAGDRGVVNGIGLYLYDRGWWKWRRTFPLLQGKNPALGESSNAPSLNRI